LALDWQLACRDFSRALAKTGNRIAAKMAMMAITTNSSISVKARVVREFIGASPYRRRRDRRRACNGSNGPARLSRRRSGAVSLGSGGG